MTKAVSSEPFANGLHDLRRGVDFIGVTCSFVCHDGQGKVLLHKRSQNCRDEQGRWDNGGGAHEFGDTIEHTVIREIQEEYGVTPTDLQFVKVYDALRTLEDGTPTHWVAVVFAARVEPEKARNNEPHKIDDIGWFTLENLPGPLHSQTFHTLESVHAAGII